MPGHDLDYCARAGVLGMMKVTAKVLSYCPTSALLL